MLRVYSGDVDVKHTRVRRSGGPFQPHALMEAFFSPQHEA